MGIRRKAVSVFGIISGMTYLLLAAADLTNQWNGTNMGYMLITDIVPSLVCGVIVAGVYFSYGGYAPAGT